MLQRLQINPSDRLKTMSKGTKEKVQLILVMSREADLYLLDEPIGTKTYPITSTDSIDTRIPCSHFDSSPSAKFLKTWLYKMTATVKIAAKIYNRP